MEEKVYLPALFQQDSILLLSVEQNSLRLLQSFDYTDGIWQMAPYPILLDDQEIWRSCASLPIYRWDREKGSIGIFQQKDFQPAPPPLNRENTSMVGIHPSILQQKEEEFLYLSGYYVHLLFRKAGEIMSSQFNIFSGSTIMSEPYLSTTFCRFLVPWNNWEGTEKERHR